MVRILFFISSRRLSRWWRLTAIARLGCATVTMMSLLCSGPIDAQKKPSDQEVEATYLLNFGKFMRHVEGYSPRPSFDICILGRDTIGRMIDEIAATESIDHHPVRVPRLADVTGAKSCEIVFISIDEAERLREDMAILAGSNVLTVSDMPGFLDRGGMIQFMPIESRMRFAVNLTALNRSHLSLSSELLKVAASVNGRSPSEVQP